MDIRLAARRPLLVAIVGLTVVAACSAGAPDASPSSAASPTVSPSSAASPSASAAIATPDPFAAKITADGLQAHLAALDAIAARNGGNRAVGTRGFLGSVLYATGRLEAFGYTVIRQDFRVPVYDDPGGDVLAIVGKGGATFAVGPDFLPFAYSPRVSIEGPILMVARPCEPEAFLAAKVRGRVVVADASADCGFDPSLVIGPDLGALALVIVLPVDRGGLSYPMLGTDPLRIPVLAATRETGQALLAAPTSRVRIATTGVTRDELTTNLVAELPGSDPRRVLMFGAHLDSARDGPGIDDNATGVAAVLETARVLAGSHPFATIRFALWSGEELGMLGSRQYLDSISKAEHARIEGYLNADMLGAPNGVRGFYVALSDLTRSVEIGRHLTGYFRTRGLPIETTNVTYRTDAMSFGNSGIAALGLISIADETGIKTPEQAEKYGGAADRPLDACYHLPCDDARNVDISRVQELTDAFVTTIVDVAFDPVAPGAKTS